MRSDPFAVTRTRQPASASRAATASGPKPLKIGTQMAPSFEHAITVATVSIAIGRKIPTVSPPTTPSETSARATASVSSRSSAIRRGADLGVLPFPHDGGGRGRALRPPVDALPGDVGAATDEPRRPRRAAGQVDDLAVGRRELEIEVVYDGIPEPRRIFDGSAHQVVEALDAVRAHEPGDVRRLDLLVRGAPDLVLRRAHRSRPVSSRPISIRRISFVPAPIV